MPLRPYEQDQMFLLPPSLNEWVRDDKSAFMGICHRSPLKQKDRRKT